MIRGLSACVTHTLHRGRTMLQWRAWSEHPRVRSAWTACSEHCRGTRAPRSLSQGYVGCMQMQFHTGYGCSLERKNEKVMRELDLLGEAASLVQGQFPLLLPVRKCSH